MSKKLRKANNCWERAFNSALKEQGCLTWISDICENVYYLFHLDYVFVHSIPLN